MNVKGLCLTCGRSVLGPSFEGWLILSNFSFWYEKFLVKRANIRMVNVHLLFNFSPYHKKALLRPLTNSTPSKPSATIFVRF